MSEPKARVDEASAPQQQPEQRISRLYALAAVLALVGLADAIYLTVEHLSGRSVRCSVTSGCSEVLASPYATIGDYPLALFGAVAYFTAFSLATLAAFGSQRAGTLFAVLAALMFATSLWLVYLQAFVLHAFCQYCLLSAAVSTSLAVIALVHRATRATDASSQIKS
ncbi:MAG TPA: vitamin K epoxide reductase family protein [Pyrinomonadaceae bacterium]|nr:vitamin K epoxide reductase family protein [Pyrinomonadaceae bacterium]